jgi:hypothetical protein
MSTTETLDFPLVVLARIGRIEKMGGTLMEAVASNGQYVAAICQNQGVHFVIYADDTFDRFEKEQFVKYRTGYTGPVINDDADIIRKREEQLRQAVQDAADAKAAKKRSKQVKKDPNEQAIAAARQARYDIKVDDRVQPIMDAARPAFEFFFEKFGDSFNRRIGTSVRERENWADPEYILETVSEKLHDQLGRVNGPSTTIAAWQSFRDLDKKYQLALAFKFSGTLPY